MKPVQGREAPASGADYRAELFSTYDRRSASLDPDTRSKIDWFSAYARDAYLPHIGSIDRSARILDVGCNRGFLLAALSEMGFHDLHGIDLSAGEIEHARVLLPGVNLEVGDLADFTAARPHSFDIVIAKAVLEHIPKASTLPFLRAVRHAVRPGGLVIIDVPNMDWLFATHERYMDFTHETGFTKESLTQVMSQVFEHVDVSAADVLPGSMLVRLRRSAARRVLGTLLSWAHSEGGGNPVWARSLVGVAR